MAMNRVGCVPGTSPVLPRTVADEDDQVSADEAHEEDNNTSSENPDNVVKLECKEKGLIAKARLERTGKNKK